MENILQENTNQETNLNAISNHSEIKGVISMEFDPKRSKNINFMNEYSKFLIINKKFDGKIMNWQIENSQLLTPLGLDFEFLKKKIKEQNKDYYKYPNLISQITYRLEKHGKLAPTKEIGRKMNLENIQKLAEEENGQNPNEINFYNLEDSFIDDGEVFSDNSENEFTKISLTCGNYTEEEILRNLYKCDKLRERKRLKKNTKKQVENENKNEAENINKENSRNNSESMIIDENTENKVSKNNISGKNSAFLKKRKLKDIQSGKERVNAIPSSSTNFNQESQENLEKSHIHNEDENIQNESVPNDSNKQTQIDSEIEKLLEEFSIASVIKNPKEKMTFVKKLSLIFRKLNEDVLIDYFLQKISAILNEQKDMLKIIFLFDKLKVKRDGIYSTVSKLIKHLVSYLKSELNINDVGDSSIFDSNPEINMKFNQILERIFKYLIFNEDVNTFLKSDDNEKEIKNFFNLKEIEYFSDEEAKIKIMQKLVIPFEKAQIRFHIKSFNQIVNDYIRKQEHNNIDDYLLDCNMNIRREDKKFEEKVEDEDKIQISEKNENMEKSKKSVKKNKKSPVKKENNFENFNSNNEKKNNLNQDSHEEKTSKEKKKLSRSHSKKRQNREILLSEEKIPKITNEVIEILDDSNVEISTNEIKEPFMSKRFHVVRYNEDDFIEKRRVNSNVVNRNSNNNETNRIIEISQNTEICPINEINQLYESVTTVQDDVQNNLSARQENNINIYQISENQEIASEIINNESPVGDNFNIIQ